MTCAIITVLDCSTNELQANYLEKGGNIMEKDIIYKFTKKILEKGINILNQETG